jgi:hypothetical protein
MSLRELIDDHIRTVTTSTVTVRAEAVEAGDGTRRVDVGDDVVLLGTLVTVISIKPVGHTYKPEAYELTYERAL